MRTFTRSLFVLLAASLWAAAVEPDVKEVTKTLPVKPDALVAVQVDDGSVDVAGWDKPDVEVRARIEFTPGPFQSKTAVQDTEIRIDAADSGVVQIRADYSKIQQSDWAIFSGGPVRPPVYYKLKVPRGVRLRIRTVQGPATVANVRGELDFETVRGEGKFSGLEGPLRVKTLRSDIEARFAKPAGPSRIETLRGDVTIYLPAKSKFDIDPEPGRGGTVTSEFGAGSDGHITKPTKVNGGGPSYRAITQRGTVSFKKL